MVGVAGPGRVCGAGRCRRRVCRGLADGRGGGCDGGSDVAVACAGWPVVWFGGVVVGGGGVVVVGCCGSCVVVVEVGGRAGLVRMIVWVSPPRVNGLGWVSLSVGLRSSRSAGGCRAGQVATPGGGVERVSLSAGFARSAGVWGRSR